MTTVLASSARRAIRSRNTKFFVSVAWGKDGPLVGSAVNLFLGAGRRVTQTPAARGARRAPNRSLVEILPSPGNNSPLRECSCSVEARSWVCQAADAGPCAQHLLRLAATQHYLGPSRPLSNFLVQLRCTGQSATASGASRAAFGRLLWIHSPSPHLAAAALPWRPKTGPRHAATR